MIAIFKAFGYHNPTIIEFDLRGYCGVQKVTLEFKERTIEQIANGIEHFLSRVTHCDYKMVEYYCEKETDLDITKQRSLASSKSLYEQLYEEGIKLRGVYNGAK